MSKTDEREVGALSVKELLDVVVERVGEKRKEAARTIGDHGAGREFSLAITAAEDAQMRFTRGLAKLGKVFSPVDLERVEAPAERSRFLGEVKSFWPPTVISQAVPKDRLVVLRSEPTPARETTEYDVEVDTHCPLDGQVCGCDLKLREDCLDVCDDESVQPVPVPIRRGELYRRELFRARGMQRAVMIAEAVRRAARARRAR